ncbi:hypothetical protein BJ878DRAFT_463011 [Calycina marina]|uniref:Uncharacterized protein n=1 Tax=Calycina marina TaxID=1763456 RepID=A0A9P7Z0M1_9HELO|nr:hypothetical protein BJ878DRAFT_463011 [Calycina marina]
MMPYVEPEIENYWNTSLTTPTHHISSRLSRNIFQVVHMRMCLADNLPRTRQFSNHIMAVNAILWIPASKIAGDGIIARFEGKSFYFTFIPGKPTGKEFNV